MPGVSPVDWIHPAFDRSQFHPLSLFLPFSLSSPGSLTSLGRARLPLDPGEFLENRRDFVTYFISAHVSATDRRDGRPARQPNEISGRDTRGENKLWPSCSVIECVIGRDYMFEAVEQPTRDRDVENERSYVVFLYVTWDATRKSIEDLLLTPCVGITSLRRAKCARRPSRKLT